MSKHPEARMFGPGRGQYQDVECPWRPWLEHGRTSAPSSWDLTKAAYQMAATQQIIPILAATTARVRNEELRDHTSDMRMKTVFHSTPFDNCRSILREGLQSCWGAESRNLHCTTSEETARHHAKPGNMQGLVKLNQHVLGLLAQSSNLHIAQVILSPTILMASNYGDVEYDRHRWSADVAWGNAINLKALPNFVGVAIIDDWFRSFAEHNQTKCCGRDDGQPTVWDAMNAFDHDTQQPRPKRPKSKSDEYFFEIIEDEPVTAYFTKDPEAVSYTHLTLPTNREV